MDFNQWFRKHEREVFKRNQGCFDKAYVFGAKNGFEAGQQSKQEKIDEALAEIGRAMKCCESIETECVLTELKELLK